MLIKSSVNRKSVRRSLLIDEENSLDLDLYAQLINSSPAHVINEVLAYFFAKDKDFLRWKEHNPDLVAGMVKASAKASATRQKATPSAGQ